MEQSDNLSMPLSFLMSCPLPYDEMPCQKGINGYVSSRCRRSS
ncbi:hypothetical protein HMPREF0971_02241 [Segatella oris F0302]|uniref:Uncharacterized protein n=1 Tax=Segatella oris F0302 TaxID=649760 RepID=D1QTB3_9BACT|nr:hypothetical protein HMPREF0971_02241 [Segatella oris F0302]